MKNKKKNNKKKTNFKILINYFKPYKAKLIFMGIIVFIINFSSIFTGYLVGAGTESVINLSIKAALMYFGIYFIISLLSNIIEELVYNFLNGIQMKISRTIGFDTYKKVMCLPAYAFEEMSSGEIINRVTNDTETVVGSIDRIMQVVSRLISSAIVLVYIFINSWIIGIEILVFLFIYAIFVKVFSKRIKECNKQVKEQNDKYTAIANESVRGIREIKTLGIAENISKNVLELIKELLDISKKELNINAFYNATSWILKSTLECGSFITCAILLYHGTCSLTFFIALTYYIYRFTWLIENITDFSKTYEKLSVAINRINEILGNTLYNDVLYGNIELANTKGDIEFKNVSFNYKNERKIFDDFNIKFEPNKFTAIVGSSGGGKSTIFNLLTRIFDCNKGHIYIDGIDIKKLSEKSLRKNISIIRQEPFIFNKTILENFKLIDEDITLDKVRKFCKKAYIDDYIMSLPKKYDTLIGEGGVNLSGGQKQRLAIARTLLKESKIILFDEATSALDNESQEYIKESIDELSKDHTVIMVAHRLSTIIDADIIYVIKDGKVYAKGKHDDLMKKCDYYKKLYTTESKIA